MNPLVSLLLVAILASPAIAETVVINATPTAKVASGPDETERLVLAEADREKSRLVILKRDGRYLWASRENRELSYQLSGAFHYFIDPAGGGYVKVFDSHMLPASLRDPGPRYRYMEHVTLWLGTITYWGATEELRLE